MPRLPVLTFPAPSLKKKSVPVEKVTSRIGDLVRDMFETMYAEHGIGLAAPQVGENINLLVMDVRTEDPIDKEKEVSHPLCFINPKIVKAEGIINYEEGCLSCPELLVKIDRKQNLVVEALDIEGRVQTFNLLDLEAVCLQHEMDHLAGILLTDHISRLKRDLYRKQRIREKKDESDQGQV